MRYLVALLLLLLPGVARATYLPSSQANPVSSCGSAGYSAGTPAIVTQTTGGNLCSSSIQSGTWTVQPGNTPNTTAWLVTGAGGTFPVTGTVTANAGSGNFSTNLAEVGGVAVALGQTTMSASLPVAIASNQSNLPANTAQVNGVTTLTGAGATGTGSQRTTVAQDTTTIAGSAPGTAGTASSNVVTVQGVASMTPVQVSQATATNLNAEVAQATAANLNATVVQTTAANLNATVVQSTASSLNATVSQATGSNLHIVCDSGCSSSTAPADESTFTAGTTSQSPVGGFYQTTFTSNPLTTGKMGVFQVTPYRSLTTDWYNSSGTEMGTSGSPVQVSLANTGSNSTAINVAQATASNLKMTAYILGNGGATMDFAIGGATAPTNALAVGGEYLSTLPTLTTGQASGFMVDSSGRLIISPSNLSLAQGSTTSGQTGSLVMGAVTTGSPSYTTAQTDPLSIDVNGGLRTDCITGCGTSLTDEGTFTQGSTGFVPIGGYYNTSITNLSSGEGGAARLTTDRMLFTNLGDVGGSAIALGQTTMSASLPVAIASNQSALTVAQSTASSLNATVVQSTGSNLHVVCDSGCSSSSAPADESTFTAGTTSQSPVGGFYQTTATSNALTTGQMGAFQVTANRALFSNLRNAAGTEVGTSTTPLQVSVANTGANGTAMLVTGSGGTFPVTGTVALNATPSLANGNGVVPTQGGAVLSATNGGYQNILQGNAALSATNGLYTNLLQGNAALSSSNPIFSLDQADIADEGSFTQGTSKVTSLGAYYNTNANITNLTTGQSGALRVDAARYLLTERGLGLTTLTTWASGTTNGTTQTVASGNSAFNAVLVQLDQGAGISAGAITFQYSNDGTNWSTVDAYRVIDPTSAIGGTISLPYTLQASTNKSFLILVNGYNALRIEVSTTTAGGSVTPYVTPIPYEIFTAQHATDLTQIAGNAVPTGAGAATNTMRVTAAQDTTTIAGSAPGTAGTASSNVVTVQGVASMTPVQVSQATASNLNATVVGTGTLAVQNSPTATASGGATPYTAISAASTNATNVKNAAGTLYHISIQNSATSARYLLLFNSASTPTCTGTPVWEETIPAVSSTGNAVGGIAEDFSVGLAFSAGIGYCETTASGGTGSVGSGDLTLNLGYK